MTTDDFLTISDVAALLKVHPETLRRWDKDGTLPAVKINDRGDRRWRRIDILAFMEGQSEKVGAGASVVGDYEIKPFSNGFESLPGRFGLIAKFKAFKNFESIGFAFVMDGTMAMANIGDKTDPIELASQTMHDKIMSNNFFDGDMFTYEYRNRRFEPVEWPSWWEGEKSIGLINGMRAMIENISPVMATSGIGGTETWRIVLSFLTKQNTDWVKCPYGPNLDKVEYYLTVTSEALEDRAKQPLSEKGVAVCALRYIRDRFEKTKDENGERSVQRIDETSSNF